MGKVKVFLELSFYEDKINIVNNNLEVNFEEFVDQVIRKIAINCLRHRII